jgi:hypothetical protein
MHSNVLAEPAVAVSSPMTFRIRFESKRQWSKDSFQCVPISMPAPASEQLLYEEFESDIVITGA